MSNQFARSDPIRLALLTIIEPTAPSSWKTGERSRSSSRSIAAWARRNNCRITPGQANTCHPRESGPRKRGSSRGDRAKRREVVESGAYRVATP